jgi:hypothetical protein
MKRLVYILFFITAFCQAQIINSYAYTSVPTAIDVFPQDNAASLADVNSTGIWTSNGASLSSDATEFYNGAYSLKITTTNAWNSYFRILVPVESGKTYTLIMRVKWERNQGGGLYVLISSYGSLLTGTQIYDDTPTGGWDEFVVTLTATGTGDSNLSFNCASENGVYTGAFMYVDNMSIIEN